MTKINFNRETLLKDIRENAVKVFFTKVNGDKRVMTCTLREDLLPPNTIMEHLDEMHAKPENKDVIAVWDLEKGGWRSFRVDNVEYVEFVDF